MLFDNLFSPPIEQEHANFIRGRISANKEKHKRGMLSHKYRTKKVFSQHSFKLQNDKYSRLSDQRMPFYLTSRDEFRYSRLQGCFPQLLKSEKHTTV